MDEIFNSDFEESNDLLESSDAESSEKAELEDYDIEIEAEEEETETQEEENLEQSEEESELEQTQDNQAETESEYEEVELATYIDDAFIPPDDFKTQKEKLEWYETKYNELLTYYNREEFVSKFLKEYENQLIEAQEDVEKLKAIQSVFESKPEIAVKLYAPHLLLKNGRDTLLNSEEKYELIDSALKEEFGEDYQDIYKEEDSANPRTISGKMFLRQKQLLEKIELHQQSVQKQIQEYEPITEEKIKEKIEEQYNDFKNIYNKNEYYKFVDEFKNKVQTYKLKDYHKLVYFDNYIKQAYEKGVAEGKKAQNKTLKTIKNTIITEPKIEKKRNIVSEKVQTPFYLRT